MNGEPYFSITDRIVGDVAVIKTFVEGIFDPQPDITAYELSIILPLIFHGMTREAYDGLGALQRHIRLAS